MLRDQINDHLKTAMKAGDQKLKVATLRLVNAAIKDRDIAARAKDECGGLGDDEILGVLLKMKKQREESAKMYEEAGRIELAEQERAEIDIIGDYLPKQMDESEIEAAVKAVITEIDAQGLKDMGKCMGVLKERHAGEMDFGKAGAVTKRELGA